MLDWLIGDQLKAVSNSVFWGGLAIGVPLTIIVLFLIWRFLFIYVVPPGHVGVILKRGRIVRRNLEPGWYPVVPVVHTGIRVYIGLDRIKLDEETRTSDNAIVNIKGTGQYRVLREKAEQAMFAVENPGEVIKDRLLSALRSAIGKRTAANCFEHKEEISADIIAEVKEGLCALGFEIDQVPITEVSPHKDVVKAINDVQAAQRATDVEKAKAEATKVRVEADANAQALASKLRGEGRAQELGAEASGYLRMIQVLTGKDDLTLDPKSSVALIMFFQNMQMKRGFAASGKSSAVILPDDQRMLAEIAELVPALMSHGMVDENNSENVDHLTAEQLEEMFHKRLSVGFKEQGEAFAELLKQQTAEAHKLALEKIEQMPKSLQWLARKMVSMAK